MSSATMWQTVAPGWDENADYVDERTADLTERVLELARVTPGDRVLELACGPGGLGLAAAELAREVVLSDVAPAMVEIAAGRARERGLGNVETRTLDLDAIDEPDASYDVVLCREGLMFAGDPAQAAREIARVLKPGGRVGVSDIVAEDRLTPAERAERGSYVGCIAGALSRGEYLDGLAAVGFVDAEVQYTQAAADGMHAAIVRATRPAEPTS